MKRNRADYISRIVAVTMLVLVAVGVVSGPTARADTYFPQTGYTVWGPFEAYWKAHGGLEQFGLPRTSVRAAGKDYDAQWFERAVFTYSPSKPDTYKVELNLLGSMATASRRGEAPFQAAKAESDGLYFAPTSHNLSGKFLDYWQRTGGLAIYGYPISEPFQERSKSDGNMYLVQYFERNRLEYHPELQGTRFEVQLGLLGSEMLDAQGGPDAIARLGKPLYYPPPTSAVVTPPGGLVDSPGAGTPVPGGSEVVPPAPDLPAITHPVLFSTDFSTTNQSAWAQFGAYNPPDVGPSRWEVRNGILEQTGVASEEGTSEDALFLTKESGFSDTTLEADVYQSGGETLGVVLRYSDTGYYLLKLYPKQPNAASKARLVKVTRDKGETEIGASANWSGFTPRTWYRITLTAKGSSLTAQIDGQQIISITDASLGQGRLGLYAYADGRAKFDNVRVSVP